MWIARVVGQRSGAVDQGDCAFSSGSRAALVANGFGEKLRFQWPSGFVRVAEAGRATRPKRLPCVTRVKIGGAIRQFAGRIRQTVWQFANKAGNPQVPEFSQLLLLRALNADNEDYVKLSV